MERPDLRAPGPGCRDLPFVASGLEAGVDARAPSVIRDSERGESLYGVCSSGGKEVIMPRRGPVERREVLPDPVYHSTLVMKFINHIMRKGKKSKAERIFYEAMELIRQRTKEEPLRIFLRAVENCRPQMEVRSRRIGGATYQIPIEVPEYRSISLSMRWILEAARQRKERSMQERLAAELLEAAQGRGAAVKKRDDVHRMAEANRAFAHFRW